MKRRLAAIMVADIVGYSRLMAADEAAALQAVRSRRETVLEPIVGKHGGRIVKVMGDGFLVEFASAVNAVAAARDIQRAMHEAGMQNGQQIAMRIGINLGDVVEDGEDILGDGVNIAARLEKLAEPGGICISAKVHDEIAGKLELPTRDLGEVTLHNIDRPLRAYAIDGTQSPASMPKFGRAAPMARPTIAVLPFVNMSDDPERQFFSDGVTEDIITELARFRQLQVTARNSSFRFRGADLDVVKIGRELGVMFLVQSSVRSMGERIRITAQLIETTTGSHIWAERYDRPREEIFDLQDMLVRTIVATLVGRLQAAGVDSAKRKAPGSLAAYECVLRADALPFDDPEAMQEARRLYEEAIALDPGYARAYALLSNLERMQWNSGWQGEQEQFERAKVFAAKAIALDDNDIACQLCAAWICLYDGAFIQAEAHIDKAVALNPNSPVVSAAGGAIMAFLGYPERAIRMHNEARVIDPNYGSSWYWTSLGLCHLVARQHSEACAAFGRSAKQPAYGHSYAAASYGYLGDAAKAQFHLAEAARLLPGWTPEKFAVREPFRRPEDRDYVLEGLKAALAISHQKDAICT